MKLLSLVFLSLCLPLSAADRAALLICNHKYQHPDSFRPIPAAVADLTTMQKALLATGFAPGDIVGYCDLKSAEMKQVVVDFAKKYAGTPEVVVYISSHGLAAGTQNFLAGVDTDLDAGEKLKALRTRYGDNEGVFDLEKDKLTRELFGERFCPLSVIVDALDGMSADPEHCKIIVLDACRTEVGDIGKFSKAPLLEGLPEGFAPVEPPSGMSFGFAAKAGQPSISNEDQSTTTPSLFTGVFARRIQQPGTLEDIFREVRNTVETTSQQIAQRHPREKITKQSPFLNSDLRRPFAFVKGNMPRTKVVPEPALRPQALTRDERAQEAESKIFPELKPKVRSAIESGQTWTQHCEVGPGIWRPMCDFKLSQTIKGEWTMTSVAIDTNIARATLGLRNIRIKDEFWELESNWPDSGWVKVKLTRQADGSYRGWAYPHNLPAQESVWVRKK